MDAKMKDCRSWIADRGLQIVDRESKGAWAARPLLHRSWDILSQPVRGASCSKSKAANEPATSSNPPHFDVQCWMFNVRCSMFLLPLSQISQSPIIQCLFPFLPQ
jgi:hypothetical protein